MDKLVDIVAELMDAHVDERFECESDDINACMIACTAVVVAELRTLTDRLEVGNHD